MYFTSKWNSSGKSNRQNRIKSSAEECIFEYTALRIEWQFNKKLTPPGLLYSVFTDCEWFWEKKEISLKRPFLGRKAVESNLPEGYHEHHTAWWSLYCLNQCKLQWKGWCYHDVYRASKKQQIQKYLRVNKNVNLLFIDQSDCYQCEYNQWKLSAFSYPHHCDR